MGAFLLGVVVGAIAIVGGGYLLLRFVASGDQ